MKKLLLLLTFLFISITSIKAQRLTSGSLDVLINQKQINFVCDFNNCTIDGKKAKSVIASDPDWDKGVKEIIAKFNGGQMETNRYDQTYGNYPDAEYTLTYVLDDIDDDEDCEGDMILSETKTGNTVATIASANGKAGHFGSFFNLLGDAFNNLGEKYGKLMSRARITHEQSANPNYNRIYGSFTSMTPSGEFEDGGFLKDAALGLRAGWLGGWNIVKKTPLYLEAGVNIQGNFKTEHKVSFTFLKLNIPVNLAYKFNIPNTVISVSPYAGVRLTGNLLAQADYDGYIKSFFSNEVKDVLSANRVQFGGQVGIGVTFKTFYLGFEYTPDFTDFAIINISPHTVHVKTPSWSATMGYEF